MKEQKASNTLNIHQKTADDFGVPYNVAKLIDYATLYGTDITKKPLWKLFNFLKDITKGSIEYDGLNMLRWDDIIIGMNSENTFYVCDNIAYVVDDDLKRVAECVIRLYYNSKIDKMIKAIYEQS